MSNGFNTALASRLLEKCDNMGSFAYAWNSTAGVPKYARSTLYKKLSENGIITNFIRGSKVRKVRSTSIDRIMSGISVGRRLYTYERSAIVERLGSKCCSCGCTCGLEVDHINADHNDTQINNLQLLCGTCHNIKCEQERATGVYKKVA